ncbi:hypothetical protein TRIP_C60020 [Candidatus Zixiibacteriota bacterium]|nr:hypothetical protein TRIP_C60020 [candidate division Zixibacteria bacterium]
MPLQQHHIDKLKTIYQKRFGTSLSDKEAWEMGIRLVNLFRLLLKSDQKKDEEVRTN